MLVDGKKRRFSVSKNQVVCVGRGAAADITIANSKLRSRHFQIRVQGNEARLELVKEMNQLKVNGQASNETELFDGDVIQAGDLEFELSIPNRIRKEETFVAEKTESSSAQLENNDVKQQLGAAVGQALRNKAAEFTAKRYPNKVHEALFQSENPEDLLKSLRKDLGCIFVLDGRKIESDFYNRLDKSERLFSWLPVEAVQGPTPILCDPDSVNIDEFFEQAWGKDALVCVCWPRDEPPPLSQIRRCAGFFHCPSMLQAQLINTAEMAAEDMMLETELIMVESENPDDVLIFSMENQVKRFEGMGRLASNEKTEIPSLPRETEEI